MMMVMIADMFLVTLDGITATAEMLTTKWKRLRWVISQFLPAYQSTSSIGRPFMAIGN